MTTPPDTGNKCVYPDLALLDRWYDEWSIEASTTDDLSLEVFIAHKACDWQRERDALICEGRYNEHVASSYASQAMESADCADAIRHQEAKSND